MERSRPARAVRAALAALVLQIALAAEAGGSAETTLLVVNADSPLSLAVANEYIRLRALPERQVLWLRDIPPVDTISTEVFRQRILAPIRAHLATSGLEDEIDLIAYSAGFPYAVDFTADEAAHGMQPTPQRGDAGSLTGMTFFARHVEAGSMNYLGLQANYYFRHPLVRRPALPGLQAAGEDGRGGEALILPSTRGFRSRYLWEARYGVPPPGEHDRYFLSAMLGYTGLRGNSLPEIVACLARAAASDGTRPDGVVYLLENTNIRSRVRQPLFPATVAALAARGRRAEVLSQGRDGQNGREPRGKQDIIGLVAGTRGFQWDHSGSRLLPGAIAESFTSYAGHFAHSSQTKLSEFLRHGAAGSSGAVREPYAIQQKFPLPLLHVHYADGASLAEAYYQSVASPYQLLVAGDPLARPFARFARVSLAAPRGDAPWRGTVSVQPQVEPAPERPIARVELWLDGRLLAQAPPGAAITVDTRELADGEHDLRLVAVEADPLETRSVFRHAIRVDNRGRQLELEGPPATVAHGERFVLRGRADGARRVRIGQGSRRLGEAEVRDGRWSVELDAATLGLGRVGLQAEAEHPDGGRIRSAVHLMDVLPPPLLPAGPEPHGERGLEVRNGGPSVVIDGLAGSLPRQARSRGGSIRVAGAFEVRASGLYELTAETAGRLRLEIGDGWRREVRIAPGDGGTRLAVPLAAGWHRFRLELDEAATNRLRVLLAGPEPAFLLAGERVRRP